MQQYVGNWRNPVITHTRMYELDRDTLDWNRIRAFLATAEAGSLSAAARALGLTQPTLGRQIAALERELGVALFERAGRGLVLTPTAGALLDTCAPWARPPAA